MKEQYVLIDFIKQPKIKKMNHLFIIDKKYPIVKLCLSKLCIKDLFKVLLHEIKGFKYQIMLHVFLYY